VIRAHKAAVLARLRADPSMASNVIDGIVDPIAPVVLPPYVVVSMDSGRRTVERESSEQPTAAEFRIIIHSVGVDADQAGYFAERVMAQLLGWRPTVAGWAPQSMQHVRSVPVQPDTTVNPASQYITDVFTLTTRRAS
jgi:hypothetical protein